ncbi:KAP family P-loop NTPase fold protein [Flexivirga alba]|uniref:P-loop NTPase fold protein n=1 Tax=Flexivirga alba TaxID=702742 RepID=A0ABW2AIS3_9MICO
MAQTVPSTRWFISDRAIERPEQDELGHVDVAAQLANIVESVQAPSTVGLIGGFGTGKSSIGNLLAAQLAAHNDLQVVTLSGERHTGIARQRALVYSFGEALQEDAGVDRKRVERVLGKMEVGEDLEDANLDSLPLGVFVAEHRQTLTRAVGWALLVAAIIYVLGVVIAGIVNMVLDRNVNIFASPFRLGLFVAPFVAGLVGTFLVRLLAPWISASLSPGRRIRRRSRAEAADELERVFGDLAALCPKRLVIVVDDIDRLPPEEVLQALATIKSLQAVPKKRPPIFVIACDDEIVRRAIQTANPGLSAVDGSQQKAADEYLNKLFLVRQPLPPPLREDMTSFATNLLSAPGSVHAGPAALGDSMNGVLEILIHEGVRDPRHVVRLLNAFFADYRLARVREGGEGRLASGSVTGVPLILARLTVMRVDFPYAYQAVRDEFDLLKALDVYVLGGTIDQAQRDLIEQANLVVMARTTERDGDSAEGDEDQRPDEVQNVDSSRSTKLPADLTTFLRRTARYVEQDVPLAPLFYLGQTGAGRLLGSRRAEEIRIALENNDVGALRSRLTDDESLAEAAVDHMIAVLGSSRQGLPLTNSISTATSCLNSVPEAHVPGLAAKIAEIITREPDTTPEAAGLADLIRYAPIAFRRGLIGKLVSFDGDGDAASPRAQAMTELAKEFPGEQQFTDSLRDYFANLPTHSGYADARVWLPRAESMSPVDRDRILGSTFYSAIIESSVGAQDDSIPSADGEVFTAILAEAAQDVKSSPIILAAIRNALAAEGAEPRWIAMRCLELLPIKADDVPDVLERVSAVCTSDEVKAYRETFISAMRIVTNLGRNHAAKLDAMPREAATEVVAAAVAVLDDEGNASAHIEAARALRHLGPVWPNHLMVAVDALVKTMAAHRSNEDEQGRAVQSSLVSLIEYLPEESGEKAAEALMSPIASATDQNDPELRMAIEAARELCRSEQRRTYVVGRVPAWRQVFQTAISAAAHVRPQAEALKIAAEHEAFSAAGQRELLTRLATLATQGHPSVDAAAEALATIPWDANLRPEVGDVLAGAWNEIEDDGRQRVVDDLGAWPNREMPVHAGLMDEIVQFVVSTSDGGPREDQLTRFWPWLSPANRASALLSDVSNSFRQRKLVDAGIEELYETLVAAAGSGRFKSIIDDLDAVNTELADAAAIQFIQASLRNEAVGWRDDDVHEATLLISSDNALTMVSDALSELGEGAARAGHAVSLIAWLRERRTDRLGQLDADLQEQIIHLLPDADADLAGRLGHVSAQMPSRAFNGILRGMRSDKENHRSRSAASAFESGRRMNDN